MQPSLFILGLPGSVAEFFAGRVLSGIVLPIAIVYSGFVCGSGANLFY